MAGLSYGRRRLLLRRRISRASDLVGRPATPRLLKGWLLWLIGWGLLGGLPVRGQTQQQFFSAPWLVREVRLEGNRSFSDETLRPYLHTTANRRFLGIPGFTWWLWLYQLGASGKLGGLLSRALMASGEPPAYYEPAVVQADVERLTLFYRQEGFPKARIEARLDTLRPGYLRVTFHINEGPPTYLRLIRYEGLEPLPPALQQALIRGALLRHTPPADSALLLQARNQRYSELTLLEERQRLMEFLWNAGYAAVTRDSIRAIVIPARPDSFDLIFQIHPGPRFRFGDVHAEVDGPEPDAFFQRDTLWLEAAADTLQPGQLVVTRRQERHLSPSFLARMLRFRPGDWYNRSRLLNFRRRLEATGLFSYVRIEPGWRDTIRVTGETAPRLPHRLVLSTRPRHRMRLETFMLQRNGLLTGSENELGTGIALTYENANLLGRAETFSLRTSGSISGNFEEGLLTSAQLEITASLVYPYAIRPFGVLERWLQLYDARTRLSLSLLTARRDILRLVIRGRGTARFRLELQHTPTLTSFVDLLDLSLSNPDTLTGFRAAFLDEVLRPIEDPVQRAQILDDYTVPQINDVVRYTLQAARFNPLRRERGYAHELSIEAGGLLSDLLDRFVFSPGQHEGTLPGLPLFRSGPTGNRLLYRPYLRLSVDMRRYRPLRPGTVVAGKLQVGLAHPVGIPDVIPFDRRFYSGGATSVRGWPLRGLGPGRLQLMENVDGANLLGGEIKLEASLELRHRLLRRVLAADWIGTLFTDVGNVWFGPRNPGAKAGHFRLNRFLQELGWGGGIGLRLAWEYLILRLDVAYRLHDPARPAAGLLPDGLHRPTLHFGIGHAF
ncbi:BamA/TamA family outer membrane protein [Rhodothermus profundi]|uniref:Outer membrane protein assembly factor BamA n=1 Tax=Rhodothermus profundi TaxID=633813 RepID=A0A1M6TN53_9BACT|nr:BamA/TamA family outer membrane protein [Rhodothermus profundi]SHK58360.1 Outer membrane protein assembly factor BamA [Rhodothermus profundi]